MTSGVKDSPSESVSRGERIFTITKGRHDKGPDVTDSLGLERPKRQETGVGIFDTEPISEGFNGSNSPVYKGSTSFHLDPRLRVVEGRSDSTEK